MINRACRFQGALNWETTSGQTEVHQAIDILEDTQRVLVEITNAIQALKVQVDAVRAATALKEEAVYGWSNEDVRTPNQGAKIINQHVVRVRVAGYPPPGTLPTSFPFIEEVSGPLPFDLSKCWNVRGAVVGWFTTTVSSYASDVPAGWWRMKTRRSVNLPEFSQDNLRAIIREIHTNINATRPVGNQETNFTDLINNFAISSATRGHYGADKRSQIFIQSTAPAARQAQ